jgi:hypothetical protein
LVDGVYTTIEVPMAFGNWTIPVSINDRGQIVGDYFDPITGSQGFLATPNAVPLPAALPLFASGLGVMAWLARRRKRKTAAEALRRVLSGMAKSALVNFVKSVGGCEA